MQQALTGVWVAIFILHRLSSFRVAHLIYVFTVFSTSSVRHFLPGKLSINFRSCSKVGFMCPICLLTLFSQRSISEWSENTETFIHIVYLKPLQNYPEAKGSSAAFHNFKADLLLSFEGLRIHASYFLRTEFNIILCYDEDNMLSVAFSASNTALWKAHIWKITVRN